MKYHDEFHGISYDQYTMTLRMNCMKDYIMNITLLETSLQEFQTCIIMNSKSLDFEYTDFA